MGPIPGNFFSSRYLLVMATSNLLVIVFFVLLASLGSPERHHSKKISHKKHVSQHDKQLPPNCRVVCYPPLLPPALHNGKNDEDNDYDDESSDNEIPIVATSFPPNYLQDPYINNESGDEVGGGPLVDFIGVKHRFSNETNQAFPAYVNIGKRNKKGQRRTGVKAKRTKKHLRNHDKI